MKDDHDHDHDHDDDDDDDGDRLCPAACIVTINHKTLPDIVEASLSFATG